MGVLITLPMVSLYWVYNAEKKFLKIIKQKNKVKESDENKDSDYDEQVTQTNYCRLCNMIKVERTHHCSKCRICTEEMDHHCNFLQTCIGKHNKKYFIYLLTTGSLALTYFDIITLLYIDNNTNTLVYIAICSFLLVNILLLGFTIFTWRLLINGLGTIEWLDYWKMKKIDPEYENKYDKGIVANISHVMCHS